MSDSEILKQLIRRAARVSLHTEYDKPVVELNEPQAPESSVTIAGIPSDAIVIKVDAFQAPDSIFCNSKGECKRADYVIISQNKKCILYLELKKTKSSLKDVIKQLTGAKCFVRYCQEVGKLFWNEKNFLKDYQHRFVSIGHTSIAKRKTRVDRRAPKHNTPEKVLKIDWPNRLQYNHLAGALA